LAELVSAVEQSLQELANHPAVFLETTLANKRRRQKEAERGVTLGETALAAEQHQSLSAAQAAELGLATVRVMVLTDLSLPKPGLAKNKQCQEDTAKKQCRADDERVLVTRQSSACG
jgi:hypothetical protein